MDTQKRKTFTMFIGISLRRVLILFVLVMLALLITSPDRLWAGSDPYYEVIWPDNVYVGGNVRSATVVYGRAFNSSPVSALPDLRNASDWLPVGSLIYGATEWGNPPLSATGWCQVRDNPLRYEQFGNGSTIFNSTEIVSSTSTTEILYATSVVTTKYEQSFVGNNSYDIVNLDYPAHVGTLEVVAITDGPISHSVEWINGNHFAEVVVSGEIISASPIEIWWPGCTYRFRYVKR